MKSVLICEDEPLIALDLEQIVYEAGMNPVGPARSFGEALELAEVTKPAVALVDLHLTDGVTGAKIATSLVKRDVKIIVLSSVADVLAPLAGIPHIFVAKPVDPEILGEILAAHAGSVAKTAPMATDITTPVAA